MQYTVRLLLLFGVFGVSILLSDVRHEYCARLSNSTFSVSPDHLPVTTFGPTLGFCGLTVLLYSQKYRVK